MNIRRGAARLVGIITHNWPLKLAAIVLAALLYVGLVAGQDSSTAAGPIAITPVNPPSGSVMTSQLRDVEQVRYIAPADLGKLKADDFRATVDLTGLAADGNPVNVRVTVTPVDPRVVILEVKPKTIQVVLDQFSTRKIQVTIAEAQTPQGLEVGDAVVTPAEVEVSGPATAVNSVATLRVSVPIDASGLDVDRDFAPDPLDAAGQVVSGVELSPADVHVNIPVYINKETRTVPVNPIVTGTPGAGFRIAAIAVTPSVVSVTGDADQLESLVSADTAPVAVSGATRNITAEVAFALPNGVSAAGIGTVTVTVTIEAVTETRSFVAGVKLDGMQDGFLYDVSNLFVTLTLFGSTADLDTIGAAPLVISVNVSALDPGSHDVTLVPSLPSGVTVAAATPEKVTVTVTPRPTPSPSPSPTPAPATAPPSIEPSATPIP